MNSAKSLSNPYTYRGMITDRANFYGRQGVIQYIRSSLLKKQCCALIGETKIGKSSILYHIWKTVGEDEAFRNLLVVYLDVSDTSVSSGPARFFRTVKDEVNRQLVRSSRPAIPIRETEDVYDNFRIFLLDLRDKGMTLSLLLDEFDTLAGSDKFGIEFRQFLRAQMLHEFSYVTATRADFESLFPEDVKAGLTSPWFNTFLMYRIGAFSIEEAREFIIQSSEKVAIPLRDYEQEIIALAGTHPLLLQITCGFYFELYSKGQLDTNAEKRTEKLKSLIAKDADLKFQLKLIWESLNEHERKAALRLAHGEPVREARILSLLIEKGYIRGENLFSKLFAGYVLSQNYDSSMRPPHSGDGRTKMELAVSCNLKRNLLSVTLNSEKSLLQTDDSSEPFDLVAEAYARRATEAAVSDDWRFHIKDIGGRGLYQDLFQKHRVLSNLYSQALGRIQGEEGNLSLVFKLAQREALRIPFEFLFDGQEYLVLKHPVSRFISGVSVPKSSLPELLSQRRERVNILLIASNTEPPIPGVDDEVRELNTLLPELLSEKGIECEVVCLPTEEATYERVRKELGRRRYHLLHYAGHGDHNPKMAEESAIYLWEKKRRQGDIKPITAASLGTLLRGSELRFAYFSCCLASEIAESEQLLSGDFLGIAEAAILAGVPAVLGYRWPVSDKGARMMAATFYKSFLECENLGEALLEARRELASEDKNDRTWMSPVLINQKS
ncbi:CHAT domain-containing protein [bacterium]|nr:CHAT domain-containing protein [bacterium]